MYCALENLINVIKHCQFSVSLSCMAIDVFQQEQMLSKSHLMVLTAEGSQALHASSLVVLLLLLVKPVLPKSP